MPNRLLLADGDPKSLRVLDVSLRKAGFEVATAETGDAAWQAIASQPPDVIIADSDLPGLDGLALCARVRQDARSRSIPFICLGGDTSVEGRIRGLQAGADEYLPKPAFVNDVITRVRALIQRRERDQLATDEASPEMFRGKLSDIAVVDLLQLVASKGKSGIIHLQGGRGGPATVYFRKGAVIDAELGRLSGDEAIGRLFGWTEGTFEIEWKNIRRPDAIGRSTADLVLDGMKRLDDWSRLTAQHPDLEGVFEVNYKVLGERLAEIPDEVNGILRLIDGKRQLGQVVDDSQLSNLDAVTVVTRLRDEGIIREVARADRPPGPAAQPPAARRPEASGVPVPALPASSGAESDSGRSAAPSGPAAPSFADSGPVGAGAPDAPLPPPPPAPRNTLPRVALPPPPPPPATKTDRGFPQINLSSSAQDEATDDDLAALGLSLSANAADSPPAREDLAGEEGVLAVPADAGSFPPASDATGEESDSLGADDIAALLAGGQDEPELDPIPAASTGSDASNPADAAPRRPGSMLETQRGIGPFPWPADVGLDGAAAPAAGPEAALLPEGHASTPDVNRMIPASPGMTPSLEPPPAREVVEGSPSASQGVAGAPIAPPTSEATANFVDREISHGEALDELGVRGRRRAVRVLVAALAVGGVAVFAVQRLRPPHPEPPASAPGEKGVVATASPSPPAVAPEPPRPIHAAETPPAPPPPAAAKRPTVAADAPAPPPPREESQKAIAPAPPKASSGLAASASDTFRRQLADCRGLFGRNRFREAGVACAAAVETNPRSSEALTMLAHVELNRGHLGRANELAQKAISIHPDQPDAYVIIGGVHQDGGRNAQAKAAYLQYLRLAPHGRYAAELRSIVGSL